MKTPLKSNNMHMPDSHAQRNFEHQAIGEAAAWVAVCLLVLIAALVIKTWPLDAFMTILTDIAVIMSVALLGALAVWVAFGGWHGTKN